MKLAHWIALTPILCLPLAAQQGHQLCGTTSAKLDIDPDPGIFGDTVTGEATPEDAARKAMANLEDAILEYHANEGRPDCATCSIPDACEAEPVVNPRDVNWVGPAPDGMGGYAASASLHGWFDHDQYQIHCTECE